MESGGRLVRERGSPSTRALDIKKIRTSEILTYQKSVFGTYYKRGLLNLQKMDDHIARCSATVGKS